ncbi:hypothetical protein Pfra02_36000 [Pseudomonas fragi]|nr:hypothetical protein Pfra02_36000 [Pseudomonas fragi]
MYLLIGLDLWPGYYSHPVGRHYMPKLGKALDGIPHTSWVRTALQELHPITQTLFLS